MWQLIISTFLPAVGVSGTVLACLAVAWFSKKLRLLALGAAAVVMGGSYLYMQGRWDQRAQDKAKIEMEISNANQKGLRGRADALRKFNEKKLPDSWFRDEE